jgi:hypothetical protein
MVCPQIMSTDVDVSNIAKISGVFVSFGESHLTDLGAAVKAMT